MGNLIKNLGGYEEAKKQGEEWGFDETLNKSLLEYRRQHNIYEIGDWVGIKDDSIKWVKEIVSTESKTAYDSQWNAQQLEILIFEDGTKLGSGWAIHATDEEIKAGYRLD